MRYPTRGLERVTVVWDPEAATVLVERGPQQSRVRWPDSQGTQCISNEWLVFAGEKAAQHPAAVGQSEASEARRNNGEVKMAKSSAVRKMKASPAASPKKVASKGRVSKFAGKVLYPASEKQIEEKNLRSLQPTSQRFKPYEYISKKGKVSFEDYVKAGHPIQPLHVLVDTGRVNVK